MGRHRRFVMRWCTNLLHECSICTLPTVFLVYGKEIYRQKLNRLVFWNRKGIIYLLPSHRAHTFTLSMRFLLLFCTKRALWMDLTKWNDKWNTLAHWFVSLSLSLSIEIHQFDEFCEAKRILSNEHTDAQKNARVFNWVSTYLRKLSTAFMVYLYDSQLIDDCFSCIIFFFALVVPHILPAIN